MADVSPVRCSHCGSVLARPDGGKVKLRLRLIAFNAAGEATAPCPRCKKDTKLPVTLGHRHRPLPAAPAMTLRG
jgi:phage FluMu protein Com